MIKKLQALKNKKGFTLVELIIVLVILAILAALLLPTLTGYIDRANKMKVESACRMAVMAVKAEVGEVYGNLAPGAEMEDFTVDQNAAAKKLSELPDKGYEVTAEITATGAVVSVVYVSPSYTCTYTGDGVDGATVGFTFDDGAEPDTDGGFTVKLKT